VKDPDSERLFVPHTEPIVRPDEDRLGRRDYAFRVVNALKEWDLSRAPLVVGIDGAWGAGKSSLISLMRFELEREGFLYREFHPWLFSDETGMTVEFFRILNSIVKKPGTRSAFKQSGLGNAIRQYGPSLLGAAGPIGRAAGESLSKLLVEPSILDKRKALADQLAKLQKPVAICVEDMDRLTPHEALRVATLIRLVGAFPNVVYLLPYDGRNLERLLNLALTGRGSDDGQSSMGRGFKERLVQFEIGLPRASKDEMSKLLRQEIDRAVRQSGLDENAETVRSSLKSFMDLHDFFGLNLFFPTPRSMTRFGSALALILRAAAAETNIGDLLRIETLRLQAPQVYARLRDDPMKYTGGGTAAEQLFRHPPMEERDESKRRQKLQDDLFQGVGLSERRALDFALSEVVPQIYGGTFGTPERRAQRRFSEPEFTERYFRFGLLPTDVNDVELANAVDEAARGRSSQLISLLTSPKADSAVLRLGDAVDLGDARAHEDLGRAISNAAPGIPPSYGGPYDATPWEKLAVVLGKIIAAEGFTTTKVEALRTLPAEFSAFALRLVEQGRPEFAPEKRAAVRQVGAAKVRELLSADASWADDFPLGMYVGLLALWDPSNVKDSLRSVLEEKPKRASRLLRAHVQSAIRAGGTTMRPASLATDELRSRVELSELLALTESDPGRDPEHVELLRAAVSEVGSQVSNPPN
jgi:hypothetical protein